jgi:hypothetical protein
MDVEWLTCDELADRLGIGRESARTLVKRKRWARKPGNDGRARIACLSKISRRGGIRRGSDPGSLSQGMSRSGPGIRPRIEPERSSRS